MLSMEMLRPARSTSLTYVRLRPDRKASSSWEMSLKRRSRRKFLANTSLALGGFFMGKKLGSVPQVNLQSISDQ